MPRKITQPRKRNGSSAQKTDVRRKKKKVPSAKRVFHPKARYGMSKLEVYFAKNFLDKFNVKYVYEYEASDIGRFYDFAIVVVVEGSKTVLEEKNGVYSLSQKYNDVRPILMIEVDGSYYHGDPRLVKESELNEMQRKNKAIDEYKDDWCRVHHIPILRVWEYDIWNNPTFVMEQIKVALNRLEASERKKVRKNRKYFNKKVGNLKI